MTKNKLLILAVNRRPVRKGRTIASDKSAFVYAFVTITINKMIRLLQYGLQNISLEIRQSRIQGLKIPKSGIAILICNK